VAVRQGDRGPKPLLRRRDLLIAVDPENVLLPRVASERASPGEQVEDQDNNGENKHEVDPTAKGVAADESENPEDDKNDGDGPKHGMFS
jgi:hypothetical protein